MTKLQAAAVAVLFANEKRKEGDELPLDLALDQLERALPPAVRKSFLASLEAGEEPK